MASPTPDAKLNSVVAAVRQWQRGAITWKALEWQVDLADAQLCVLCARVCRTSTPQQVADAAAQALGFPAAFPRAPH